MHPGRHGSPCAGARFAIDAGDKCYRRQPQRSGGRTMAYDLILRGGRVIDPSQGHDAVADVAFAAGKVARVAPRLDADGGTDVRDVSGRIVVPGLIDLHTHVYWGGTSLGIDAEEFCRTSGVTTA